MWEWQALAKTGGIRFVVVAALWGQLVFCGEVNAQQPAKPKINFRWTTNNFEDVDAQWLAGWLRRFGVSVPQEIQGKLTAEIEIGWPIGALTDPNEYRLRAKVVSQRLRVGPLTIGDVSANFDYRKGLATLTDIKFELLDRSPEGNGSVATSQGRVQGRGTAQLVPAGDIVLDVDAKQVLADFLAKQLGTDIGPVGGQLSGRVFAKSDVAEFTELAGWEIEGTIDGRELTAFGRPKADVEDARFTLKDGKLVLDSASVTTLGGSALGSAEVVLQDDFAWKLAVDLPGFDLTALKDWTDFAEMDAAGDVNGQLTLNGTLEPSTWNATGELLLPSGQLEGIEIRGGRITLEQAGPVGDTAKVQPAPGGAGRAQAATESLALRANGWLSADSIQGAALGRGRIESAKMQYRISRDSIEFSELQANVGVGTIDANGSWPLVAERGAEVQGRWQGVDLGPFVISKSRKSNVSISANSSGDFRWSLPPALEGAGGRIELLANSDIPSLIVNGKPCGNVALKIRQPNDSMEYSLSGELFGGSIAGEGVFDLAQLGKDQEPGRVPKLAGDQESGAGSFELQGVDLGLFAGVVFRDAGRRWRGRLNLSADISPELGLAKGTVEIAGLRYQDTLVSDLLSGKFEANMRRIRLDRFAGRCFDGRFSARGMVDYSGRGELSLELNEVDANALAISRFPWIDGYLGGPLSARLRASGSDAWRIAGTVTGTKNQLGPFEVERLRASVMGAISPYGNVTLQSRDIRARLAKGQIAGKAKMTAAVSGVGLDSQWKFSRVGLQALEDALGGSGAVASGDMSGTLTLRGKRMREFKDLNGVARMELHDAGARALPLVPQLQRYLIGMDLSGTTFRSGQVRATLGQGRVNIDELLLTGPQLTVSADGQYSPMTQRIDMEIAASTVNGAARNAARRTILSQISAATPITAALANVGEVISDRVIQIHVGGTVRSPSLTLRPCPTLRQEVVRIVVRQLTAEVIDIDF